MATIFATCVLLPGMIACGAADAPEDGFAVNVADEEDEMEGVRCGYHATIFVLEYFGVEYVPASVSSGLPMSEEGASLADIQQTLSAFGFEAAAQESVTLAQLAKALNRETLGIIPLPVGLGRNHYFVAALDNTGSPVLANIPYGVSPLEGEVLARRLEKAGGVVLFLRRTSKRVDAMSDHVRVSPTRLDLGQFLVTGPDLEATFTLRNTSPNPIMVSKIRTSCGCTKPDWTGGILRAKETRPLRFRVYAGGWGQGARDRPVLISFGDGSNLLIPVHGDGLMPIQEPGLELSQGSVSVDVSDKAIQDEVEVRICRVNAIGLSLDKVIVATESAWLSPRLVPIDETSGELRAKIDIGRVVPELDKSSNRVAAGVTLSTQSEATPVGVQVNVFRRVFFHFSQDVVRIASGKAAEVSILPNTQGVRLKVADVYSEWPGLLVEATERDGGVDLAIDLDAGKATSPGYYFVKCAIESSLGTRGVATLTVQVVSEN